MLGRTHLLSAALVAVLLVPAVASADDRDLGRRLDGFEEQAHDLGEDLPPPNRALSTSPAHQLVDAEVEFGLGNYDAAAISLFDLSSRPGAENEAATYYLAESLYERGDRGAAHEYFAKVVQAGNTSSRYYQPSLERLIEIGIATRDDSEAAQWLGDFDRLGPGQRLDSVPYVRAKYAFSKGDYDGALAFLQDVPKGSEDELQAAYYTGAIYVAKKDLARATEAYLDLTQRKPRTARDRRVIELSQLALGRLYYERDEPAKSIDAYLLVDRRSDLFPDALYEVSWVYVKSKQYDKALRALELLVKSEPQSQNTPTVRILEGNLRIRKAQMIRAAQVDGLPNGKDDPTAEYDKAAVVFTDTHDAYAPSYAALDAMIAAKVDPALYLDQLAGRSEHAFAATAPLPEGAAQMLRDEPAIQGVVQAESDLEDVSSDVREIESMIARLEGVLAANDKSNVYPSLAARRAQIASIQDELVKVRDEIADREGNAGELTTTRKQLSSQYLAMPNAAQAASATLQQALAGYDAVDAIAVDTQTGIDGAQAMAVALRKYVDDPRLTGASAVPDAQKQSTLTELDADAKEAAAIEDELADVRREEQLGRDLAGVGDAGLAAARALRKQVTAAQTAEHRALAGQSHDQAVVALGDRAARIADQLDATDAQIETLVGAGLAQARELLDGFKSELASIKTELDADDTEGRSAGGDVLASSLATVKAKLYDIVIRTDVGNVDVSWSQKEDNDDDLKRLTLARSRELKQLRDEFHDILDETTPKPSEVKKPIDLPPVSGDQRVSPSGGPSSPPAAAAVRPEAPKDAPKAPAKGGSK